MDTRNQGTRFKSTFYRDTYHRVLRWLLVEAVIILLLILGIIYNVLFEHPSHFYVTTTSGQIMALQAGS